jgi:hypothetical protein
MTRPIDAEWILDAYLAPEHDRLPDRVMDAALAEIARTPQRRAPRVPWRFPSMPATRATGVAAVVLVAAVAAGGLIYLRSTNPGVGGPKPSPSPTLPPAITGWTTYTSQVYGEMLSYPSGWSVRAPATRKWLRTDVFPADEMPYADTFVSPGQENVQIGLIVWEVPVGENDFDPFISLRAFAQTFCSDSDASSCGEFPQRAMRMCANETGECRTAILVPTSTLQWAFVPNWGTQQLFDSSFAAIRIVVIAREDSFPQAAPYGGSVELLKSVLTTMHVWGPN